MAAAKIHKANAAALRGIDDIEDLKGYVVRNNRERAEKTAAAVKEEVDNLLSLLPAKQVVKVEPVIKITGEIGGSTVTLCSHCAESEAEFHNGSSEQWPYLCGACLKWEQWFFKEQDPDFLPIHWSPI